MAVTPTSTAASVTRNHAGDMADLCGPASTTTPTMTTTLPAKDAMTPLEASSGKRSQGTARAAAVIAVRSAPAPAPQTAPFQARPPARSPASRPMAASAPPTAPVRAAARRKTSWCVRAVLTGLIDEVLS